MRGTCAAHTCLASPSRPNQLTQNRSESIYVDGSTQCCDSREGRVTERSVLLRLGPRRAVVHRLSAAVKTPLYSSKRRSQAFRVESEKKGARLRNSPALHVAIAILGRRGRCDEACCSCPTAFSLSSAPQRHFASSLLPIRFFQLDGHTHLSTSRGVGHLSADARG